VSGTHSAAELYANAKMFIEQNKFSMLFALNLFPYGYHYNLITIL